MSTATATADASDGPTGGHPLRRLFAPTGVAVIGASTDPAKLGKAMADGLAGYGRHVALVNPRAEGMHASIADAVAAAPEPIELAVLCVPAAACADVLAECGEAGVRSALVCAGGFAEAGGEGIEHQRELLRVAHAHHIRLLGPNTSGFFVPGAGLLASFVPGVSRLEPGSIAVVAASGGLNHALAFAFQREGAGLSLAVGLGAGVDVGSSEVLDYLAHDPATSAIALHLETVDDGPALLAAVRAASRRKPVVAFVVGQHDLGEFAMSHTGALATSWRTTRSVLRQAGAVLADDLEELVAATMTVSRTRVRPQLNAGAALVTGQAGPGLVIADAWHGAGVSVPALAPATRERIAELLPPITFQANPVDTGRPGPRHHEVVSATANDPDVAVVGMYGLVEPVTDLVAVAETVRESGGHSIVLGIDGPSDVLVQTRRRARDAGVPLVVGPRALSNAIKALVEDAFLQALGNDGSDRRPTGDPVPVPAGPLSEAMVKDVLDAAGIATPQRRLCHSAAGAALVRAELRGPLVAKISDATVLHKSDVGGVRVGLRTVRDLENAIEELLVLSGTGEVLVETMAPPGADLIVSARRDSVFGPVVMVGVGGTATEVYSDAAIAAVPASERWLTALPDTLVAQALLDGHRGTPAVDRADVARVLGTLGDLLLQHPGIEEVEINPLRGTADGLVALDAVLRRADDRPGIPDHEPIVPRGAEL